MIKLPIITGVMVSFGCGVSATKPSNTHEPMSAEWTQQRFRGYVMDMGNVPVPEVRGKSTGRTLILPVARIRSSSATPLEPIFGLTGGPGMSNMAWKPPDALLAEHDFIMVGYRGVDGSVKLDLPEVEDALRSTDDLLGEASMQRLAQAWRNGAQRLRSEGVDLDGYTMAEVIEDIDAARQQLGYERIHLLSESYGTRVAYLYGLVYPDRVARSVMIGVNPPGRFVWEPDKVDEQLRYYAALWAKDNAASARCADLLAAMDSVLHNMPKRWMGIPINAGKVRVVSFALLFNRKTAAMVLDAYVAAAQGDASGLALLSVSSDFILPKLFTWGDLAAKAVSADLDPARDYTRDMDPDGSHFGSPLSQLLWGPLAKAQWPTELLPDTLRHARRSEVHTLMIGGSLDFSTPAEFATQELLPNLPNGQQVVLHEVGHVTDIWKVQPKATERLVTTYLRHGVSDTSLVRAVPMNFEVRWGFPLMAKLVVGTLALLLCALGYGAFMSRAN